ncbi:MAG: hypothetical protein RL154_505 [Pseudomonadota bacterium]|jgi:hypothetical protein
MNKEQIVLQYGIDNIFEYGFMNDFTTVTTYLEDGGDLSHIDNKQVEKAIYNDDFYCVSEDKIYSKNEIYKKFNIVEIGYIK